MARIIVHIELTPLAKDRLNELTDKAGMTQVALLSRLVEWFAGQSDDIKASVLSVWKHKQRWERDSHKRQRQGNSSLRKPHQY